MKYVLLSHTINQYTPLYGNTPPMKFIPYTQISQGDSSNTFILSIHNHTGTHIDAPKHFINTGKAISDYSIEELIFKKPVVIDCLKDKASLITINELIYASNLLQKCDCLLLHTGYEKFRNEKIYQTHNPGIAPETILWIRKEYPNIRCIGIDSISISSFQHRNAGRESHKNAFIENNELGKPLLLIEDMSLKNISKNSVKKIIVIPWMIDGLDSAPCTVVAVIK